jgi:hypothetical protein
MDRVSKREGINNEFFSKLLGARVAFAPFPQRLEDRAQFAAAARDHIFGARRMILIEATLDDAVLLERLETRRQRIRADAVERLFEVAELARPLDNEIAQDHQSPSVADDVERARNGTLSVGAYRHQGQLRIA